MALLFRWSRATVSAAALALIMDIDGSRLEDLSGDQNGDGVTDICDVVTAVNLMYRRATPITESQPDLSLLGSNANAEVQRVADHVFNGALPCIPRVHCGILRVIITDETPAALSRDEYDLIGVSIAGHMLTVHIGHGGGCLIHGHQVYMSPSVFEDASPRIAHLYPQHGDNGDGCEAYLMPRLPVDVSPILRQYRELRGPDPDSVILRVHDHNPAMWRDVKFVFPTVEPNTDSVVNFHPTDTLEEIIARWPHRDHD